MNETERKGMDNSWKNAVLILWAVTKSFRRAGQSGLSARAQSPYFLFPGAWSGGLKQRLFAACLLTLAMFSDEKCSASVLEPSIKSPKLEGLMPLASPLSGPYGYDTSSVTELCIQYIW